MHPICATVFAIHKEYRLLKGALFASVVMSMAAAPKKEKKRRSLPLEAGASSGHINKT